MKMKNKIAKVPQIMQMEAVECGAACLAMILAYYGKWIPLEQARLGCGVSRDGSKVSNILKAARSYGLEAKGMSLSLAGLKKRDAFPCIVFWNFNHFVVVDGVRGKKVWLNDPGRGHIAVTVDEFEESFTGIALIFKKTDAFVPGGSKPDIMGYIKQRLRGMKSALLLVTLMTALTSLAAILFTSSGTVFLDRILSGSDPDWLPPLIGIMLVLAAIQGFISIFNAVYLVRIQGKTAVVSSSRFMQHLLRLPVRFYAMRSVGDLQMRQNDNEKIVYALVAQLAPVLFNGVMLILYLLIMLNYSLPLTAVGICTVVLNAFVAQIISRKRVNATRRHSANAGKMYGVAIGGIQMIETIQSSGAENRAFAKWAHDYAAYARSAYNRPNFVRAMPACITTIGLFGTVILHYLAGKAQLSVANFMTFSAAYGMMTAAVVTLSGLMAQAVKIAPMIEMSKPIFEAVPEISRDKIMVTELNGGVEVTNVSFRYDEDSPWVLENLSFTIKPGEYVAFVGRSGCGKSTIVRLLLGFEKPAMGSVFYGSASYDVTNVDLHSLRRHIGTVMQNSRLFSGDILNNIILSAPSCTEEDAWKAAEMAGIAEDIRNMPMGMHTIISEGGGGISGGQRQRLMIARAICGGRKILILDEATSALDNITRKHVTDSLAALKGTRIVVAHRLSTVQNCDRIFVLDGGKIAETGTYDELIQKNGIFAQLVSRQQLDRG